MATMTNRQSSMGSPLTLLLHLVLSTLAIVIMTNIVPGVQVANWMTALSVAIVLGIVNIILRPILMVLSLPINLLTLGLFSFVVNALLLMLVAAIIPGFTIASFWAALLASVVLSLINWLFGMLITD